MFCLLHKDKTSAYHCLQHESVLSLLLAGHWREAGVIWTSAPDPSSPVQRSVLRKARNNKKNENWYLGEGNIHYPNLEDLKPQCTQIEKLFIDNIIGRECHNAALLRDLQHCPTISYNSITKSIKVDKFVLCHKYLWHNINTYNQC